MSEDDIVRKIMQVVRDFNDTDEFCACQRLSIEREIRTNTWIESMLLCQYIQVTDIYS